MSGSHFKYFACLLIKLIRFEWTSSMVDLCERRARSIVNGRLLAW